jgi:hypothetical protein
MNGKQAKKLRHLEQQRIADTLRIFFRASFKTRLWIAWKIVLGR